MLKTLAPAQIFLFSALAFIAGIGFGNFFVINHFWIFCVLLFFVLLFFLVRRPGWKIIAFWLIIFLFGVWRFTVALPDFSDAGKIYHYNNQTAQFSGRIANVDVRINKQKIILKTEEIFLNGRAKKISGKILINELLYPEYSYGDHLIAECDLQKPEAFSGFDYERYLAGYNIFSICYYPKSIKVISAPSGSAGKDFLPKFLLKPLLDLNQKLSAGLSASLVEPQNALLQAMILNNRGLLAQSWLDKFSNTGVTHIIAVSGSHIAIISMVLMLVFVNLGVIRQRAFWLAATAIASYIILIGAPASAVRSAIMGIAVLLAQKIGRLPASLNVIAFSASAMLLFNPNLLLADAGFQLSFLAVFGLIYLSPLLERYFSRWPDFWQIKEILLMTFSAQIMTLPLILFYFHKLSIVAFLANALILPTIPFLMVWGFINSIVGIFSVSFGRLFGFASHLGAGYFLRVVEILNRAPFGYLAISLNVLGLVLMYIAIGAWMYYLKKKAVVKKA